MLQNSILLYSICAIFFQLVIDGLYKYPFPEQYLVRHTHQFAFYVDYKLGNKLYSIDSEFLKKSFADIPLVLNLLYMNSMKGLSLIISDHPRSQS